VRVGSNFKAYDAFFKTGLLVTSGAWLMCRHTQKQEQDLLRSAAQVMALKDDRKKEAAKAEAEAKAKAVANSP